MGRPCLCGAAPRPVIGFLSSSGSESRQRVQLPVELPLHPSARLATTAKARQPVQDARVLLPVSCRRAPLLPGSLRIIPRLRVGGRCRRTVRRRPPGGRSARSRCAPRDHSLPLAIRLDHPRCFGFIPSAPDARLWCVAAPATRRRGRHLRLGVIYHPTDQLLRRARASSFRYLLQSYFREMLKASCLNQQCPT